MNLTRRDVLHRACGAFAVAAIPARGATGAAAVSEVTSKLGAYMSAAGARMLPREGMEQAKYHILDTFAAMISGAELAPGKIAIRFAKAHLGEKVATVVASDAVCGAIDAALSNGMLAHSD